jgi:hypothetical protein
MIRLRAKALEKRVARTTSTELTVEPAAKVARHSTAAFSTPRKADAGNDSIVSIVPPSTIRRMLGYVWNPMGASTTSSYATTVMKLSVAPQTIVEHEPTASERQVEQAENRFLSRLQEHSATGKRVTSNSVTTTTTATTTIEAHNSAALEKPSSNARDGYAVRRAPEATSSSLPHPLSSNWRPAAATSVERPTPTRSPTLVDRQPAPTRSSTASGDSSRPTVKSLYPPLNPPLSQRSTAIRALFDPSSSVSEKSSDSSSTSAVAGGVPGLKGRCSTSVRDIVRSIEDSGAGGKLTQVLRRSGGLGENS